MVTSTMLAALLCSLAAAGESDSYAAAHREAQKGKPLVVLVSTEGCPPCQQMKHRVLPQLRRRGVLAEVAFAIVDAGRQASLTRKLTGGSRLVPQLLLYRKTTRGWKRRKLVGGQSVAAVEEFIKEGLAAAADPEGADEARSEPQ